MEHKNFQWAKWWQKRCFARKEPNKSGYWGRCELVRGHEGDHALERGMDILTWSTDWTTQWLSTYIRTSRTR